MKRQRGSMEGFFYIAVVVLWIAVAVIWNNASCKSQAKIMGFPATWGPVQGCMIEYKPGKWISMERYRAVD